LIEAHGWARLAPHASTEDEMGEMIVFKRPDGKTCPGYLALPAAGKDAPGIVVIQEWWGLNDQIKKTGDRFAAEGFRSLVPDLFRGKVTKDADEAGHWMGSLNFPDAAEQDVRGAVQHLKQHAARNVAVGGFCMGGAVTLVACVKVPEVDAGACFYGIPPNEIADPSELQAPLIAHFAQDDDWCNPDAVDALEAKFKLSGQPFELYRYDAQHAFMNEQRPEVYAPEAAKLAWQRTIAFLKKTLS
jgi:carboxymethylenebutenolidase